MRTATSASASPLRSCPTALGMHLSMGVRTAVNLRAARLVEHGHASSADRSAWISLPGPVGMAEVMADTAKYSMISFFQLVAFYLDQPSA